MARFALARATLFSFVCSYWNLVLAAPSSSPSFTPKSFLSISHPTLPEYFIRLTQPDAEICDPSVTQYSGYLDEPAKDKHFFFWFFESRNNPETDPLVLWLNGGPGCSSMTGLFMELGPCLLNQDGSGTDFNPYSWNNNASVIFLDQPVNVGYSYGPDQVHDTDSAAEDVYAFLQLFFSQFPDAGHYIPAIGKRLVQKDASNIQLKSLLVGNGLVDPLIQYGYYAPMVCDNHEALGLIDDQTCGMMKDAYPMCKNLISMCYDNPANTKVCVAASDFCNFALLEPYYTQSGRSPYDIRKDCSQVDDSLCDYHLSLLQDYLNRDDIKGAIIGAADVTQRTATQSNSTTYANCNIHINYMFQKAGDWMRPYVRDLKALLDDHQLRVLVYAGDQDFICNWLGNKAWTMELEWHDQEAWRSAPDLEWGNNAGQLRTSPDGQFAFLRVYGAGHMTPADQPENSLEFFNAWIQERLN
ncbi:carboxypeptidase [Lichtheimia corymbifera JMRC:FSU:9682]|uniref:carboxypeptidase C n=1 Tax=Lichtheimia corymbifera JMRC:FSU:9682 TaxID=1263082 RepID=A0A068S7K7_9FUNG|nr:carboxypeptidase [Lichtheimia corymbifera JMRC:FSU:9682]